MECLSAFTGTHTAIVVQKESPPSLAFAVGVAVTVRSTKDYVWKSLRSNVNGVTAVIVIRAPVALATHGEQENGQVQVGRR